MSIMLHDLSVDANVSLYVYVTNSSKNSHSNSFAENRVWCHIRHTVCSGIVNKHTCHFYHTHLYKDIPQIYKSDGASCSGRASQ